MGVPPTDLGSSSTKNVPNKIGGTIIYKLTFLTGGMTPMTPMTLGSSSTKRQLLQVLLSIPSAFTGMLARSGLGPLSKIYRQATQEALNGAGGQRCRSNVDHMKTIGKP